MIISPIMKYKFNASLFKRVKVPSIAGPDWLHYETLLQIAVVYYTDIRAVIEYILTTGSSLRLSDQIVHDITLKKKAPVVNMLRYDTLILKPRRRGHTECR